MTTATPLEILDLRHYKSSHLRAVLDAENVVWRERLHWDYRASAQLLLQYLDAHTLPGYVAIIKGRIVGYSFFVYDQAKAVIGDVFSVPQANSGDSTDGSKSLQSTEIEETLLHHLLETLFASPGVERIESQLLFHPSGLHTDLFRAAGFRIFPRLFLYRSLLGFQPSPIAELPHHLEIMPWSPELIHPAGQLIVEAYQNHLDSQINDQYRTIHGALRFLHNVVQYPGCGVFAPADSRVVYDCNTHQMVGLLLCSRISPESGHITQICVHPDYRRQGIARLLLALAADGFARQRISEITLTVTASNTDALSLYRVDGYQTRHRFDATVWEKE